MNLYQIDQAILACMDDETGEVLDFEALEALSCEREKKLENIALYIKNLDAEAKAIKDEEDKLKDRRTAKANKAKRLKEYLTDALGGQGMETARVKLSFRKSNRTEIQDEGILIEYLETHGLKNCVNYSAPTANKSEVGKLLKEGKELPGAAMVTGQNLQIK